MDLDRHVEELRRQLSAAVEADGESVQAAAERLGAALDAAAHLVMLDVLGEAAAEITRELAPGSVEVRLRGRQPELVVNLPPSEREGVAELGPGWAGAALAADLGAGDEVAMTRVNLRLSEQLKQQVDRAAAESGLSINAWLVRAAASALGGSAASNRPARRTGDRFTGWTR